MAALSRVEIDTAALAANVVALRRAATAATPAANASGMTPLCCAMVKGNAYGHGLVVAARAFLAAGVDWLGIGEIDEAVALAAAGIDAPTYAVCPVLPEQAAEAVQLGVRVTVYSPALIDALSRAAREQGTRARVHLKVETGTNRQGVPLAEAVQLAERICRDDALLLEGCSTHFADIEDTTDHTFAQAQQAHFEEAVAAVRQIVGRYPAAARDVAGQRHQLMAHASNTAAVLLWPGSHRDLLRIGIGAYGMWPSKETLVSARQLGRERIELQPALTWKTSIAQVKHVPVGGWVGYGRTFRAVRPTRIAILPVGYYDGYDRGLSNLGEVLVAGQRARVIGRVAMNMIAIDVTDNAHARQDSEVVLLGSQRGPAGEDCIGASEMAAWLGTIHYEVTTRIHPRLARLAT